MIRTTLASLNSAEIAAAFNTVYTGYFMPFDVDAGWVEQLPARNSIDFAHSPVWLDDSRGVIALAALGVRGERGWVGGFGVAPAYRGRGLSHELTRALFDHARAAGIRLLRLEVLTQNAAAIRTYLRAGFQHERDLLSLRVVLPDAPSGASPPVEIAATPQLLEARARMASVRPAWQREPAGQVPLGGLRANVIGEHAVPRAIGLFVSSDAGPRLMDAAALDDEAARELLATFVLLAPGRNLTLWNEPEASELLPALHAAGWSEFLRQHELAIDLSE